MKWHELRMQVIHAKSFKHKSRTPNVRESLIDLLRNLSSGSNQSEAYLLGNFGKIACMVVFWNNDREAFSIREYRQKGDVLFVLPNRMRRGFSCGDLTKDASFLFHLLILPKYAKSRKVLTENRTKSSIVVWTQRLR